MGAKLTLVPTPLGNLGDVSDRIRQTLSEAEFVFAEDTRVSGRLLELLGLKRPLKVLNEHTSEDGLLRYVELLEASGSAALVTDAGTPGISDPGARLVDLCLEAGIEVDALPGPSAVTLALSLSGFYAQRFAFLGFLGKKSGAIRAELAHFVDSPYTLVLFESPYRLDALLSEIETVLGPRRVAICREMTKMHQQVVRIELPNRPSTQEMPRKGEFTVVVEGKRRRRAGDDETG